MLTKHSQLVYSLDVAVAKLEDENTKLRNELAGARGLLIKAENAAAHMRANLLAANERAAAAEARTVLTDNQIDDMIFGYAPSCKIGEGRELIEAILAASAAPTAPDGWKMTPIEPTDAMVLAPCALRLDGKVAHIHRAIWASMIAAAPAPAASAAPAAQEDARDAARWRFMLANYNQNIASCFIKNAPKQEEITGIVDAHMVANAARAAEGK